MIQSELVWENPKQNRLQFSQQIDAIKEPIDLIILPEMFTTGFTMNPEKIAETMTGKTVQWLIQNAKEKNVAITGSLIIKEAGNYYNRLLFVFPSGMIETYDKRHTFTLAGEDQVFTAGKNKLIVDYKGWKICPLICYDLRFPVWARNKQDYELLIYVANWPKPRIKAWQTLLKARAIENMSYCIGVNRVGTDENNHIYTGNSLVFDGLGEQLLALKPNTIQTDIISLDKEKLLDIRTKFQFLNDSDSFQIIEN